MDHADPGLITEFLMKEELTVEERNLVIAEAIRRYQHSWMYIVRKFLPNHCQREADHDDVLQQALLNLDRLLQNKILFRKQGSDLCRILNRVVRCDAIDQFQQAARQPLAQIPQSAESEDVDLPTFCIFEFGGLIQGSFPDPALDFACRQIDEAIVMLWDELNRAADHSLKHYSTRERAILEDWLRGEPGEPRYKYLQEKHAARSVHEIRQLTFDFCNLPEIDRLRRESWRLMLESERESAGVMRRVWPAGPALRLISDSRVQP